MPSATANHYPCHYHVLKFANNNIHKTECNSLACTSIATIQWQFVVENFVVENLKGIMRHTLSLDHTYEKLGDSIPLDSDR